MIIKVRHKNGTPLQSTVTRGELTAEMRDRLTIPAGNTVEDYEDFNVWRNKRGEVRAVRPGGIFRIEVASYRRAGLETNPRRRVESHPPA